MAEYIAPATGRPYATIMPQGETSPLEVPPDWIRDLYRQHGAILLRGFETGLAEFRDFTAQFCTGSVFNESPDRQLLDDAHNIQSVNGGCDPFPLHPELSREPFKPDVCFFCCLVPPNAQGETTICDGVELVRHLPPALRQGLAARRLLYLQPAAPELLEFWLGTPAPTDTQLQQPPPECPYAFFRLEQGIFRAFTRPALHRPMFVDAPAFGNFLLFGRYYLGLTNFPIFADGRPVPEDWLEIIREAGERLSAPISWRKGDLLMLDNTRFMHGRNRIVDPDDRLIASYFGYLQFAPVNPEEPADPLWRRSGFRPPQRGVSRPRP